MEIFVLLAVVVIIGALLGGKSFGGTVRKGCGFLIMLLILGVIAIAIFNYSRTDTEGQETISTNYFAKENCTIYSKPDIGSTAEGNLETGKDYFVEESNKYNYFYEITFQNGRKLFVGKDCLERK